MKIPQKFYKVGKHPVARNVGQLKQLLAELPDDLPVDDGWGSAPQAVVYNHGTDIACLQLVEVDDD